MAKSLLFVAVAAVFLGVVIMLLPIATLTPAYMRARMGIAKPSELVSETNATKGLAPTPSVCPVETERKLDIYAGVTICPSSLLYAGLMIMLSFFFALGIFLYFKRQIV